MNRVKGTDHFKPCFVEFMYCERLHACQVRVVVGDSGLFVVVVVVFVDDDRFYITPFYTLELTHCARMEFCEYILFYVHRSEMAY